MVEKTAQHEQGDEFDHSPASPTIKALIQETQIFFFLITAK